MVVRVGRLKKAVLDVLSLTVPQPVEDVIADVIFCKGAEESYYHIETAIESLIKNGYVLEQNNYLLLSVSGYSYIKCHSQTNTLDGAIDSHGRC